MGRAQYSAKRLRGEVETMTHDPTSSQSLVAIVDRDTASVMLAEPVSDMAEPALLAPLTVSLGFGWRQWGVALYLIVEDAMRLHSSLGRLLADLAEPRNEPGSR